MAFEPFTPVLAVIEDAIRDGTPSAIVAEASKVSMVATRRLQLVAAEADMPLLLLRRRRNRDQDPFSQPSAAWTRWRIGVASSARLEVAGVGRRDVPSNWRGSAVVRASP